VNMVTATNPGGPGFIGGSIFAGANKTASIAAAGATVVFFNNANQDTVAYAVADANGNFTRPNLPYGTYRLAVDYLNHSVPDQLVTISAATPSVSDVEIEMVNVTSATEAPAVRKGQTSLALWPNPAQGQVWLRPQLPTPATPGATATVRDVTGRTVMASTPLSASTMANDVYRLDVSGLNAGIYLVTVTDGVYTATARLVVQ